jgi:DNA-binding SARP family transcriptional activator
VLTLPWVTEIALLALHAGRDDGRRLLEAVWPAAHPYVEAHAAGDGPLAAAAAGVLKTLPVPPPFTTELRLLGGIELRRDGRLVDHPDWVGRERVRSLVACLALLRRGDRDVVVARLWPDRDAKSQLNNFGANLSHLRRVLEPNRRTGAASFLVRVEGTTVELHDGPWFSTDLWQLDELCELARREDREGVPSTALSLMRRAVALWRGGPDALVTEAWGEAEVERRRQQVCRLALRAAELLLAGGDHGEAAEMAEVAIAEHEPSVQPYAVLVSVATAAGDRVATERAVERYRALLEDLALPPAAVEAEVAELRRLAGPDPGP